MPSCLPTLLHHVLLGPERAKYNFFIFLFFFGYTMRHAGSYLPDRGSNLCPLQWKPGVLTTGPPGQTQNITFQKMALKKKKWLYKSSLVAQTVKNLPDNAGDPGSIPGSERTPGEGNGYLLQYSCFRNSTEEPGGLQSMGSKRAGHD